MNIPNRFNYPEWNFKKRTYAKESEVIVNLFDERNPQALAEFEKGFGNMSLILARILGQYKSRKKVIERRSKHSGKLNPRYVQDELVRLHSGRDLTQKIFDRRINPNRQLAKDSTSIGLLLDQSGSTRFKTKDGSRRIDLIKYAALTLGRGLAGLDDPFFIYSYHSDRNVNPTVMEELKNEYEKWDRRIEEKIAAIEETSETEVFNNVDGAAIRFANERIGQSPLEKKFIFLLTDGTPNADNTYYEGEYAMEDTKKAMEEGNEQGIHYIYLTINPDRSAEEFLSRISHTTDFSQRYSEMNEVIEGLTLVYERLKQGRIR